MVAGGGLYTERIQVIVENIVRGQKEVLEAVNNYKTLGGMYKNVSTSTIAAAKKQATAQDLLAKKQRFYGKWSRELGVNTARVRQILQKYGLQFNENGDIVDLAGRKIRGLSSVMRRGVVETKRFQMQWLSLLFFGMAMKRMFGGLIKTSLNWVGITELSSTALGVFFLPVAEELLNILLPIMNWFMNIPEPVQKAVGEFVILGAALGGILTAVGQLALGLAGLSWLTGITGVKGFSEALNIAKGNAGGLLTKLGVLAKWGGVAISIALIVHELKKKNLTAAIGAATLGVGIYTGDPYLIGIGVALMLVGDKELLRGVFELGVKVLDKAAWIGEEAGRILIKALQAGITGNEGLILNELNKVFKNITSVPNEALMKAYSEGKLTSNLFQTAGANAVSKYREKTYATTNKIPGMGGAPYPWEPGAEKYYNTTNYPTNYPTTNQTNPNYPNFLNPLFVTSKLVSFFKKKIGLQSGGFIKSEGLAYLHSGETVIPKNSSNSVNLSVTYNVNVSDKREFEDMLNENNIKLTEDVRRLIKA